jgi:predicted transcriptional regulator of viral defense system
MLTAAMRGAPGASGEGLHISSSERTFRADLPLEAAIPHLAERQHGVVGLLQLQALGVSASAVRNRVADGRLYRIHRGVYAVRHPRLSLRGRWMAATLAYGPTAVLSHASAAELWGIHRSSRPPIHITLFSSNGRARKGVDANRSAPLTEADIARVDGIPCTSVARTLVDLGDHAKRREIERAVDRAEVLRLFDLRAVEDALGRAGRRRGASVLRAVLADYGGPTLTRRKLEERFLALCRGGSVPVPEANAWITLDDGVAYQADFLWRSEGLIVETDGREVHTTRTAFEHDRLRDQRLTLAGFTVVRFTWQQVTGERQRVLRTTRRLLARLARP